MFIRCIIKNDKGLEISIKFLKIMNQNTMFTIGLLVAGLFIGYLVGSNYSLPETVQQSDDINIPSVSLVEEWSGGATGDVTEISSDSITISSKEQMLTVSFANDLLISKATVIDDEHQEIVEGLNISDIEVGSTVGLNIIADNDGNTRTNRISLFETQL